MAGGRVVVEDLSAQDIAIGKVLGAFPNARLVDRRESPIVGYHAAHFVIRENARSFELQIRTEAQQRWAQLSEKFADLVGFQIKYGGGPEELARRLTSSGRIIYLTEKIKQNYRELLAVTPDHEREFGRDQILAEIAASDTELEEEFSELDDIIRQLMQD